MAEKREVDYILIGQGLAGSVMALELLRRGKTVLVFDSPEENTSSVIAAGLMNPITGKRMTLTWLAADLFPRAQTFYANAEERLATKLLYPLPIYRVFSSIGEQNDWAAKAGQAKYQDFIQNNSIDQNLSADFKEAHLSLRVDGGGRVDVRTLIKETRAFLQSIGAFEEKHITSNDIKSVGETRHAIGDVVTDSIIFCTGLDQDVWSFLPFTPMKGEVLNVEADLPEDKIVVGGCFFSPDNRGGFYAGATYDWRNVNTETTDSGRTEILNKLGSFVNSQVRVVKHSAGIRPAVKDRRPLLGRHPEIPGYYLFSGLGSKGVSMAPYLVDCLIDFIEHGTPLNNEMDLNRYS